MKTHYRSKKITLATLFLVSTSSLVLTGLDVPAGEDFTVQNGKGVIVGPLELGRYSGNFANTYARYYDTIHRAIVSGSYNSIHGPYGYPGRGTVVMGSANTIRGENSITSGYQNLNYGHGTIIVGDNNDMVHSFYAGPDTSAIFGSDNTLSSAAANGHPRNNTASLISGSHNYLQTQQSFMAGYDNRSVDEYRPDHSTFILGRNNHYYAGANDPNLQTPGYSSIPDDLLSGATFISGQDNYVYKNGKGSQVLGRNLRAHDPDMVVLGTNNKTSRGAALVVGNGSYTPGNSSYSDAFIIKKNGDIIIPKVQGDISMGIFGN